MAKKRLYWCNYGCGRKVRFLMRDGKNHDVIYQCYGCAKLFRKTSIGDKRPFVFEEVGDKNVKR